MRSPVLIATGLISLALLAGWATMRAGSSRQQSAGGAKLGGALAATPRVVALGTLEPKGGVCEVGATVGERLDRLTVDAGQTVQLNDPLAYLASYNLRKVQVDVAELAVEDASRRRKIEQAYGDSLVAEAELGVEQLKLTDLDIQAQEDRLKLLQANLEATQRNSKRIAGLADSIVSPQERDQQNLLETQAQEDLAAAKALLNKTRKGRDFAAREAQQKLTVAKASRDRMLATVNMATLAKNVDLARAQLEMSIVRAPAAGQVLDVLTQAGETVGQRPIMRMGDVDHMYAVAEVYETQVSELAIGQRATIASSALRRPLSGTVERIGTLVSKNEVMSLSPTSSSDLRVVKVHVRLDDSQEAARLVNLQVTVTIETAAPADSTGPNAPAGQQAPRS